MYLDSTPGEEVTKEYEKFNFWCTVEIGMMAATILTNVVFLFARSFVE